MGINLEPVDIDDYVPETVLLDIKHKLISEIALHTKSRNWCLFRKIDKKWLYEKYETMPADEIPLEHLSIDSIIIRVMCLYFNVRVKDKKIYNIIERNLTPINWINVDFSQPLNIIVSQLAKDCLTIDLDNNTPKESQPIITIPLVMSEYDSKSPVTTTIDRTAFILKTKRDLKKYKLRVKVKNIGGSFNYEETVMLGRLYGMIGAISVLGTNTNLLNILKIPLDVAGTYKVKLKIIDCNYKVCKKKKFYFNVVNHPMSI